jgi:hypothetical protein
VLILLFLSCIRSSDTGISIISVYTDNLDSISSTPADANDAQVGIKSIYNIMDIPCTVTLVGMTIEYDEATGTISISSCPYIKHVLAHYGMSDCNPKSTPLPISIKLTSV